MHPSTPLTGSHLRTYQTIFRQPSSGGLGWLEVHALLRHVGQVEVEPDGQTKVTRNGEVLVLDAPRTKEVGEGHELLALRDFLERSEKRTVRVAERGAEWLVVMNHHEARLYRSTAPGAVAQQVRPHRSDDARRTAPADKDFSRGRATPEENRFFEPVAALLSGAGKILLFGSGEGNGSEMEQFSGWLKRHRPEVAKRIVGMEVVDEHQMTDAQLLAQARDFFAKPPAA